MLQRTLFSEETKREDNFASCIADKSLREDYVKKELLQRNKMTKFNLKRAKDCKRLLSKDTNFHQHKKMLSISTVIREM